MGQRSLTHAEGEALLASLAGRAGHAGNVERLRQALGMPKPVQAPKGHCPAPWAPQAPRAAVRPRKARPWQHPTAARLDSLWVGVAAVAFCLRAWFEKS